MKAISSNFTECLNVPPASFYTNHYSWSQVSKDNDKKIIRIISEHITQEPLNYILDTVQILKEGVSRPLVVKFTHQSNDFILHLFDDSNLLVDRHREVFANQLAGDRGLAPKVIFSSDEGYITEFVCAPEVTLKDFLEGENIISYAQALKEMHSLADIKQYEPHSESDTQELLRLLESFNHANGELKEVVLKVRSFAKEVDRLREQLPVVKGLVHSDIWAPNVFFDQNEFKFIDFEGANLKDVAQDLAQSVIMFGFNKKQKKLFLEAYYGRELSSVESEAFEASYRLCLLLIVFRNLERVAKDVPGNILRVLEAKETVDIQSFLYERLSSELSEEDIIQIIYILLKNILEKI